jgi:mRNA-degrading endonuclease RelE of RelBE toxin-antitoxin system
VSNYKAVYEKRFQQNLQRYSSFRKQIKQKVERILKNPYRNTEFLADVNGKLNLIGCRSIRINRNFRVIFVICEECRYIIESEFCFCDNFSDDTVVFLTVGPHDRAYAMK